MERQNTRGVATQDSADMQILELGKASEETRGIVGRRDDWVFYLDPPHLGRD